MKKGTFFSKFKGTTLSFLLKNMLIALLLVVVLVIGLYYWLGGYTRHGQEVEVPQITGLSIEEATVLLQASGLTPMVVDSTYSKKVQPGLVVDQIPQAESKAKSGRIVYVILNARQQKQIVLPSVWDMSSRQAEISLQRAGLQVDSFRYEPSQYRDLVLDVEKDGVLLTPGSRLVEGTRVVLVIGQGLGDAMVKTPSLLGLGLTSCRSLLLASRLTLGAVEYDEELTDENQERFVVYQQIPSAGTTLREGSTISLKLSLDMEKAVLGEDAAEDEEFF